MCPEKVLEEGRSPIADDFTDHSLSPSCAAGRQSGAFGGLYEVADKTYLFTVPASSGGGCFGSCEIFVDAPQEFVLYGLEGGDCGGAEVACKIASDATGGGNYSASIDFPIGDSKTDYTVVVADRFDLDGGGFQISSQCIEACP